MCVSTQNERKVCIELIIRCAWVRSRTSDETGEFLGNVGEEVAGGSTEFSPRLLEW